MFVSLKLLYDYFKKILKIKQTDYWDNNPFVIL